jgi:hypothetical protein
MALVSGWGTLNPCTWLSKSRAGRIPIKENKGAMIKDVGQTKESRSFKRSSKGFQKVEGKKKVKFSYSCHPGRSDGVIKEFRGCVSSWVSNLVAKKLADRNKYGVPLLKKQFQGRAKCT